MVIGKDRKKRKSQGKRRMMSILLAAAMVLTLAGCGGGDGEAGSAASDPTAADMTNTANGTDAQSQGAASGTSDGQTAMGRYVEEEIDLSEQLSGPLAMRMLDDGSIVIMDSHKGIFVSKDQGFTWDEETPDWLNAIIKEKVYISSMAMTPNGTAVVNYDETPGDNDYNPTAKLFLPDGTEVPAQIALTGEEYVKQVIASDDGRIYADTVAGIYEIHEDGSSEKVLTPEYTSWVWAKDNLMFIDSGWDAYDRPLIYDMNAGDYVEDVVFAEFTNDNYGSRDYNGHYSGTMQLMPGDDETVYVVGSKGIHRHAVGGNMVEQIVDGNLSLLSNPYYNFVAMIQPEENVFIVLCSNGKLLRFVYDPNVPSVPENMLTIYSLREDDSIRQAISFYQTQNPDTFVSYEIGMSEGDAVTREDAVKKLNTEIMAGTGPDLIVLDDLPINSYVSKGLLLDLTDYLAEYSAGEPLFDNIIDAMKIDGKAYMAPASVALPMIAARETYTANMTDLSGVGEAVEQLREEHPEENIIGICSPGSVMKRFAATSAPQWVMADGTLDSESIAEYLKQCKNIYDAQMDGLDADIAQYYTERSERMAAYEGIDEYMYNESIYLKILDYICSEGYLLPGWVEAVYYYIEVMSLDKVKGFEDTKVIPMEGQCSNVFMPKTLLGINAASKQISAAQGFMDVFLSTDAQSAYNGFAINRAALDIQFTPNEEWLEEDGGYGGWATSDADGNMITYRDYWPTDEQIAAFKEQLASLGTAYIPDSVLEKAVFDGGTEYIRGQRTLEESLGMIERTVAIYMAE